MFLYWTPTSVLEHIFWTLVVKRVHSVQSLLQFMCSNSEHLFLECRASLPPSVRHLNTIYNAISLTSKYKLYMVALFVIVFEPNQTYSRNTLSTQRVVVPILRPVSKETGKLCWHQKSKVPIFSVLVMNSHHKQFLKYDIYCRGASDMIYIYHSFILSFLTKYKQD